MPRVGVGEASTTRPIVVLVGAAGAGKGTQASILAADLGYRHLATGDLFRAALRDRTVLGEQARVYMERGDLVPDELTIGLVAEALADPSAATGVILDGFPRTAAQALALDAILAAGGDRIGRVVAIEVPDADLVARLSGRWSCPSCGTPYHLIYDPPLQPGICNNDGTALTQRDDDREEVVRARLTKQIPPMREVIDHYRAANLLTEVDGSRPIDDVTAAIRAAVGA
jgi:adenylate kinase